MIYRFFFICFLVFINFSIGFTQNNVLNADSVLKNIESSDIPNLKKAEEFYQFSLRIRVSNPKLAIKSWLKAIDIYEAENDEIKIALIEATLGEFYAQMGLYELSVENLMKAYKIYVNNRMDIALAWLLIDMGNIYFYANELELAKSYYNKSLSYFIKKNYGLGISVIFLNYGLIKEKQNEIDSALFYFNKSLDVREKMKNPYLISHIYHYLARGYLEKDDYEKTRSMLNKSNYLLKNIPKEYDLFFQQINSNYTLLANSYEKEGDFDNALLQIDSALFYAYSNTDTLRIFTGLTYKADLLKKTNKLEDAVNCYEEALVFTNRPENLEQKSEILIIISELYLQLGIYSKAQEYLTEQQNTFKEVNEFNEKRKHEALLLALEAHLKNIEIETIKEKEYKKNWIIVFVIIVFTGIFIFIYILYLIKNRIFKSNRTLINTAFEGVIVHHKGSIFDINESFKNFSGFTLRELKNKNIFTYLIPNLNNIGFHNIEKNNKTFYQTQLKHKDGFYIDIEAESHPINYYGKQMTLVTIKDISEQIKANAQIHLFKTIIEQNFSIIVITDIDGSIEYVNPSYTKMTGYTLEETIGKNPRILKSDFHNTAFYEELWRKIKGGEPWNGIFKNIDKEGRYFWEEAYITPIKDNSGNIIKFVAIKQNITQKRELEAEVKLFGEKLKRIFDTIEALIFVVDFETEQVVTTNKKAFEAFGEAENKKISTVLYDNLIEQEFSLPKDLLIIEMAKPAHERNIIKKEIYIDNRKAWYEINMRTLKWVDGSRVILIVAYDITKNKKTIMDLNELNATKDKFFSIISHDLKNPFQGLLGFSELLLNSTDLNNTEMVRTLLTHIYNTSKSSYKLLENLLEWSNLQKGITAVDLEYTNLRTLVNETVEMNEFQSKQKNIKIETHIPENLKAYTDIHIFSTVLRNLLSNAIKFTPLNGLIIINAEEKDEEVIISVKDNGVGIPQEMLPRLFRIDAKYSVIGTAGEKGNGLGLILCKELVLINGGTIYAESSMDKGSTFYFTLKK